MVAAGGDIQVRHHELDQADRLFTFAEQHRPNMVLLPGYFLEDAVPACHCCFDDSGILGFAVQHLGNLSKKCRTLRVEWFFGKERILKRRRLRRHKETSGWARD